MGVKKERSLRSLNWLLLQEDIFVRLMWSSIICDLSSRVVISFSEGEKKKGLLQLC